MRWFALEVANYRFEGEAAPHLAFDLRGEAALPL
jgi:hypothetical protein